MADNQLRGVSLLFAKVPSKFMICTKPKWMPYVPYNPVMVDYCISYMMTSSNGIIFCITGPLWGEFTGEFSSQKAVTRSFDVSFDLRPNKRLSELLIWDAIEPIMTPL